jgi:hypothetical protein
MNGSKPMSPARPFAAIGLAALLAIFAARPAFGGTYTVELGFEQDIEHDDNIDFSPTTETGANGYILTPHVGLNGRTERWVLGANLDTPFERYSESRLDSDNQDLDVRAERTLERGSLGIDASVLRDSTHSLDESGIVERIANRRIRDTLSAHWTRKIGQRHEITLTGTGQKAMYDSSLTCNDDFECHGTRNLNDYTYSSVQFDWSRLMSERTSTQLSVFATRFEAEQPPDTALEFQNLPPPFDVPLDVPNRNSDTVAIQGGLIHAFSEKMHGSFLVGVRRVESKTPFWGQDCLVPVTDSEGNFIFCLVFDTPALVEPNKSTSSGGLGSVGLDYAGERLELGASLTRKLTPSGVGFLLDTNEALIDLSYRLRQRLQLRLHARALDSDGDGFPYQRKHYEIRPHARWQFRQNWWLDGGVEVRSQDLSVFSEIDGQADSRRATSHVVFVSIGYRTDPIPVFR